MEIVISFLLVAKFFLCVFLTIILMVKDQSYVITAKFSEPQCHLDFDIFSPACHFFKKVLQYNMWFNILTEK